MQLAVALLLVAHLVACAWWALGCRRGVGTTWVMQSPVDLASLESKYLVSLHWSLLQLVGGAEDKLAPANLAERLFASATSFSAYFVTAVVVSLLASRLTRYDFLGGRLSRQLAALHQYLSQNGVPADVAFRVQRSAEHALNGINGELTRDTVELLSAVSEPLRVEMHSAMYSRVLSHHPFFADCIAEAPNIMRRICHYAMDTMLLCRGDVLFSFGEEPANPKVYFVRKGTLTYIRLNTHTVVQEPNWVAEAVLWTCWKHQGTLMAGSDAKVVSLDAKAFMDITRRSGWSAWNAGVDPRCYAADFVEALNSVACPDDTMTLRSLY